MADIIGRNEEAVLDLIYRLTRMPIRVFAENWEKCAEIGGEKLSETEYDRKVFRKLQSSFSEKDQVFLPYHEQAPIGIWGCKAETGFYVLGPFCYGHQDTVECKRFLRRNDMKEYPVCRLEDAQNVIRFLLHGKANKTEIPKEQMLFDVSSQNPIIEETRQLDAFQKNHTYVEEEFLHGCIRQGNVEYLKEHIHDVLLPHPVVIADVKKNEEYMTVTGISLAIRAAVEGGIGSKEAFLHNDMFLKKVAACKDIEEMQGVLKECYLFLAKLVRDRNKYGEVPNRHVAECKRAIIAGRFQKLTIEGLANEVGISKEYLQKLFKKHEGIPITEYIIKIKLEAACNMLAYSDRKISEIAEYLQFESISHFSVVFKRKLQLSPKEYREKYQRTVF